MTITSPHNQKLKEIRKLRGAPALARAAGRFVAEGEDLLEAADAAGWEPSSAIAPPAAACRASRSSPSCWRRHPDSASGTRALAVYEERWAPSPLGPLCVYLHGVHDPGNVGAVLRSAHAFGASCVALGPDTADPFGPKAVRASMGAVFAVPLARTDDVAALPGTTIALASGRGRAAGGRLDPSRSRDSTLLIGAEREGLPEDASRGPTTSRTSRSRPIRSTPRWRPRSPSMR